MTLGIVGLGLIGGSIARAAIERRLVTKVLGVDPNAEHRDVFAGWPGCEPVATLVDLGMCELIVIATPPDQVLTALDQLPTRATVFDVASVKGAIISGVPAERRLQFVGSHPIAGNEGRGPAAADPDLFAGCSWVLTPDGVAPERIAEVRAFVQSLGANPYTMSAEEHDAILALTSHLPNLLANILVGLASPQTQPFEGPSWRSATRVAGGNPELWTTILSMNASEVCGQIDRAIQSLEEVRDVIANGERMRLNAWLDEARCD